MQCSWLLFVKPVVLLLLLSSIDVEILRNLERSRIVCFNWLLRRKFHCEVIFLLKLLSFASYFLQYRLILDMARGGGRGVRGAARGRGARAPRRGQVARGRRFGRQPGRDLAAGEVAGDWNKEVMSL